MWTMKWISSSQRKHWYLGCIFWTRCFQFENVDRTFRHLQTPYSACPTYISAFYLFILSQAKIQTLHLLSVQESGLWSDQSTPTLPHGAFDTGPDWTFGPLRGSNVVIVQPCVGDLVFRLRVRSCPRFRTCHHHRQRAPLRLKLNHMELLLVGPCLVGFLKNKNMKNVNIK